jgi:hypothetical protein
MQVFALLKEKAKTDAYVSKQEKINKGAFAAAMHPVQEKFHSESSAETTSPGRAPSSDSVINLQNCINITNFDIVR